MRWIEGRARIGIPRRRPTMAGTVSRGRSRGISPSRGLRFRRRRSTIGRCALTGACSSRPGRPLRQVSVAARMKCWRGRSAGPQLKRYSLGAISTLFTCTKGAPMRSRLSCTSSIALGLLLVASACGHPASTADTDLRTVNALRAQLQQAENAGLTDAFMSLCAADVVVMPPNADPIVGTSAMVTFVGGVFRDFAVSEHYQSSEAVVSGDWAFDRGTYDQTVTPKAGGAAVTEHGKYLWLLHRGADGSWKYARTTWNANAAPVAPSPSHR